MTEISLSIVINASPAAVRAKFLKFEDIPKYSPNSFIKSIETKTKGEELKEGTSLHVVLDGLTVTPTVVENSPRAFVWLDVFPLGLFKGFNSFIFSEGPDGPNTTTFTYLEQVSGPLSGIMGENWLADRIGMREKTVRGTKTFNEDLKRACEQLA